MAVFTVEIFTQEWERLDTQRVRLRPTTYSSQAVGGPLEASVEVEGDETACAAALEWLRYGVIIREVAGSSPSSPTLDRLIVFTTIRRSFLLAFSARSAWPRSRFSCRIGQELSTIVQPQPLTWS